MTVASSSSSNPSNAAPKVGAAAPPIAQTPAPLVELKDVGIWYQLRNKRVSLKSKLMSGKWRERPRTLWALRHINFACHAGQTVGIVGHNGAGKSTLCLVLARILQVDEGVAAVHAKTTPLFGLGTGFNNELSGTANIYLFAAFLGIPRATVDRKLKEIVAFSELGEFIDQPIYTYSSGMRARLGFSVATMLEPEILVLDEVLSVGDRSFRAKSRARMMEMMEQSKLIFIVSHSTNFLRRVCTHCLWLDHGLQKAFGEVDDVLDQYEESTDGGDEDFDDESDEV